jgi:hypothetical protein
LAHDTFLRIRVSVLAGRCHRHLSAPYAFARRADVPAITIVRIVEWLVSEASNRRH